MSIASAIVAKQQQVADAYTAISNKGGTLPQTQDMTNMPTAINSIPSGGSATLITKTITQNGTYNASSDNADGYSSVTVNVSGGGSTKYGLPIDGYIGDIINGDIQYPSITGNYTVDLSALTTVGTNKDYILSHKWYYSPAVTTVDLSNLVNVKSSYAFDYAFAYCNNLSSLNISKLETVSGGYAFQYAFQYTSITSVTLSKLTTTANYAFRYAWSHCRLLTSVSIPLLTTLDKSNTFQHTFSSCMSLINFSLPKLTIISGVSACANMLSSCDNITSVSFPKLTTISGGNALSYMLSVDSIQTTTYLTSITFPVLSTITGANAFIYCFRHRKALTSVSFPALTTTSFGSNTNQFSSMINGITGCTLHFPSNLSTVISGLTGYPNFGGTSTIIAFDLPATS